MNHLPLAIVAVGVLVFLYFVARGNELFVISIRGGKALVLRGRVPPGFLSDVRSIVRHVNRGTVRASKADGYARLTASGVDERALQRLRNAFSVYPASRLRAAPPIARPTMGQVLGIAWLAWMLESRT